MRLITAQTSTIRLLGRPFHNLQKQARFSPGAGQGALQNLHRDDRFFLDCLEGRDWLLTSPESKIKEIRPGPTKASFLLIQDDLLHPLLGGNKLRKLDALLPKLASQGVSDVVTCGGVQSAHTAAVAAACAERGIRAHLLVRGERPAIPTGHHLLARMFGHVTHVTRQEYSDRAALLAKHEKIVAQKYPEGKVCALAEGAANPFALLGLVRLVQHLAASRALLPEASCSIIVESGTGTTATGLAIGVRLLDLPWKIIGVTLAGPISYYQQQQKDLKHSFEDGFGPRLGELPLKWVERITPRKFGKVVPAEIATCSQIAKEHGVLLDPIYTLAGWEMACNCAQQDSKDQNETDGNLSSRRQTVAMLHTGGAAGLHGLAQRFPECF